MPCQLTVTICHSLCYETNFKSHCIYWCYIIEKFILKVFVTNLKPWLLRYNDLTDSLLKLWGKQTPQHYHQSGLVLPWICPVQHDHRAPVHIADHKPILNVNVIVKFVFVAQMSLVMATLWWEDCKLASCCSVLQGRPMRPLPST